MLALALAACHPDPTPGSSSSETDPPASTDTGDPVVHHDSGTTPPVPDASGLAWSLNADVGSVVLATWSQDVAATVHVEYSFDPDTWDSSPPFDAAVGPQAQVLVGIPFGTAASWRLVSDSGTFDGPAITTGPLPPSLPLPEVTASDPTRWDPSGRYLLTAVNARTGGFVGGRYFTMILDRQGRVVWAKVAPMPHWTLFPQVSSTGDYLLLDEDGYWSDFDGGRSSKIHETWLDEEFAVIDAPGLEHAFVQLPDGTLAWGSGLDGYHEALVEKAPGAADETVIWSCDDDWDTDWGYYCSSNGLYYDAVTDSYLYSFWTDSTVVAVARSGDTTGATPGSTLWWAGGAPGGYAFDPGPQFYWQHGVSYTPERTLLVSSTELGNTGLREYEVDPDAHALRYVWGSDSGVRADNNGGAWRLPGGNSLHLVGTAGVAREVAPDGTDVWRLDWHGTHNVGEGQLIEDLYPLVKPRD